jgi:hypothetical protein
MWKNVVDDASYKETHTVARVFDTPECGVDFCSACSDCLECYAGDYCIGGDTHIWVEYVQGWPGTNMSRIREVSMKEQFTQGRTSEQVIRETAFHAISSAINRMKEQDSDYLDVYNTAMEIIREIDAAEGRGSAWAFRALSDPLREDVDIDEERSRMERIYPRVKGIPFVCECGGKVFYRGETHITARGPLYHYVCYNCNAKYEGE